MKFVILFFSVLIFSGCATHEFSKSKYSNAPNYDWSGGVLHYGEGNKYNEEKISSLIIDFCQDRKFRKISIENAPYAGFFFDYKSFKLEFECINEKNKP